LCATSTLTRPRLVFRGAPIYPFYSRPINCELLCLHLYSCRCCRPMVRWRVTNPKAVLLLPQDLVHLRGVGELLREMRDQIGVETFVMWCAAR
jgi:hypothetical protein